MVTRKKTAAARAAEAEGRPLQSALRRPRICFERIVPDELDPERGLRRALRAELMSRAASRGGTLDANAPIAATRMALALSKKWEPGRTLRCRFLDGSARMRAKVEKYAKEWEKHANIRLRFVAEGAAEIRISFFADDGSWSAVGRDALNAAYFPPHQPTMNFGWVRDDSADADDRAVVLHEFGHALGCIHEHQSPNFDRDWNEQAVLTYFQGPPNYWDAESIRHNVLSKYSPNGVIATRYDPESIMLYWFDAGMFDDGGGATNQNTRLSALDKKMIGEMYPAAAKAPVARLPARQAA